MPAVEQALHLCGILALLGGTALALGAHNGAAGHGQWQVGHQLFHALIHPSARLAGKHARSPAGIALEHLRTICQQGQLHNTTSVRPHSCIACMTSACLAGHHPSRKRHRPLTSPRHTSARTAAQHHTRRLLPSVCHASSISAEDCTLVCLVWNCCWLNC